MTKFPLARILVVDDTRANIRLLASLLDEQGYNVQFAFDGEKALASVDKNPPDLILLDVEMPGLNGYEVCERLKANSETQDIPVIFISALSELVDKVKGFAVGGVDYVTKPFQVEEVLARVETHLILRNLQLTLQARNEQLQSELALAYKIQQGLLLPVRPIWPHLDMLCYNTPARQLGGDFYNYHAFSSHNPAVTGHRYAVAIGDISGKGVAAALLMATALSQLDASLAQPFNARERLLHLDQALLPYTQSSQQNCAMCYVEITIFPQSQGITDGEVGWLHVVNAGCIPPFLRRGDEVTWLEAIGLPLGLGLGIDMDYVEVEMGLKKGDFLVLTSDGLVEVMNDDREMFGFEQLEKAIAVAPNHNAKAMLDFLITEVRTFVGEMELSDDLTLTVIKI